LPAIIFNACSSIASAMGTASTSDGLDISARGAVGRLEQAVSEPMYSGDGGSDIRLAVLTPEIQGDMPGYLPLYIQGLLNNNMGKFSAISLIDRQHLNSLIAEQNLAASGRFSDRDFISIGNLTNAQYFLFGTIQKLSGDRYSLQLSVTESNTGVRKATFMKDGTLTQFEGRGTLLNEATADLLQQLGIQLTEAGRQTLLAGNASTVQAEAGLAKGITAQAGGAEIEALFNFTQAITFDPSQLEALSRLNTLSTSISGGTISQKIVNDIQARDRWIEVFKESARFFNEHPPFEIIFDPSLMQLGETDFVKRTANLGMRIMLNPSEAGFSALNALLNGLNKTGRRDAWKLSDWPLADISPKTAGTVLFGGTRSFSAKIDVALLNDKGKNLGNKSITLNTGKVAFSNFNSQIQAPDGVFGIVDFPNIKADDLTPSLTIVIAAVNEIPAHKLASTGYIKVDTGDLEKQEFRERDITAAKEKVAMAKKEGKQKLASRRDWGVIDLFYQWEWNGNNIMIGAGIPLFSGFHWSPKPFTSIGIEMAVGICGHSKLDSSNGSDDFDWYFRLSPELGFIYPFTNEITFFSDAILEIGYFGVWHGLITDWMTPAFDVGFIFFDWLNLKYRGTWYQDIFAASLSIGASFPKEFF